MKKLYGNPVGSSWRKWDLHIHSKHSKETSAKLSVEDIFKKAIEKEISVIAITDHSNVEALDEAWKLYESTFEKDGKTYNYNDYINFIPGMELKTDKGNKPIHLIALFPQYIQKDGYQEKVDTAFLKSEFLSKLSCTDSNIRAAGEGNYDKGLLSINVNFETACDLAREMGGITVVHNGSKSNGFDGGLTHSQLNPSEDEILNTFNYLKTNLMTKYIDVCELPSLSKSNLKSKEFYLEVFNKPCIHCSDSHSEYTGEKYTFIKADPTFEGLKQIIFEPKNRVHLGGSVPIDPIYRIDKVTIDFPQETRLGEEEFCLTGSNELYFSPNLTCIIGGRGSGKSTVLNLIHEKLLPLQNRFFEKHTLSMDGDKKLKDYVKIDDDDDEKYIEFLSQNEIEEFALDHGKFTKAIFSRLNKLDESNELEEHSETLSLHLNRIEEIIKYQQNLSALKKKKADCSKELITNKKLVSSLEDNRYTSITKNIQSIDEELQTISSSKKRLSNIVKDLETVLKKYNTNVKTLNLYDEHYKSIIGIISQKFMDIKTKDSYERIKQHESSLERQLTHARKELSDFLEERGLSGENLKDISEANQNINRFSRLIKGIEEDTMVIANEIREFQHNEELQIKYEEKISEMLTMLNQSLLKLNEHVKTIELKYQFNDEMANSIFLERVKEKFTTNEMFNSLRTNDIKKYLFCCDPKEVSEQKKFLEALAKVGNKTKTYKSLYQVFSDESNFEVYKLLIAKVYSDVEQFKMIKVYYDGKPLENTSFGQRCTAAIVVLLLLGNNPIIIDEPEAHLDSSLIADYLVEMIKESKLKRQIIFATHNANFVINGDAELIHFLGIGEDRKTTFSHLTIENTKYRKNLLRLEGGQRAFEQREKRYQFK
ncbi:TrlF family AAA-like ATPase [Fictibacillus sp. FJAT-27399]|uniref:TrlF family AAA-like ATPase n=1 Tax=Fictibacillus sp. FJAT-27399 TaxID=1729689 RepID=UPI0007813400|nr:PHP domain-containing protein [Fictibacillus sp. FJAT-27399]